MSPSWALLAAGPRSRRGVCERCGGRKWRKGEGDAGAREERWGKRHRNYKEAFMVLQTWADESRVRKENE